MNEEESLKMTELDYMTAIPHLQMIKAALPYVNPSVQRFISLFVKASELQHTVQMFDELEEEALGICSLEADAPSTPLDMLNAMKPYGTEAEQEFIDLIINFLESSRIYQSYCESTEDSIELQAAEQLSTQIPERFSTREEGGKGSESFSGQPNRQQNSQQNQRQNQQQGQRMRQQNQRQNQQQGQQQNSQQGQQQNSQQRNFRQEGNNRSSNQQHFPLEQLKYMLPPDQQSKLETAQLLMQTFQQFS